MKGLRRVDPRTRRNARSLRRDMTDAERLLWRHLRQRQVEGYKFRRQHPVGHYIVDFACLEACLIVEVDGGQHADRKGYDIQRTAWLKGQGFRVLRFWNTDVVDNIDGVREAIRREVIAGCRPPP
jgi:very-short-patch-repair endonuclease